MVRGRNGSGLLVTAGAAFEDERGPSVGPDSGDLEGYARLGHRFCLEDPLAVCARVRTGLHDEVQR
jgi:hypothetical protein